MQKEMLSLKSIQTGDPKEKVMNAKGYLTPEQNKKIYEYYSKDFYVPIPYYPRYGINIDGDVINRGTGKHLKRNLFRNKYYTVTLYNEEGPKTCYIRTMVSEMFYFGMKHRKRDHGHEEMFYKSEV